MGRHSRASYEKALSDVNDRKDTLVEAIIKNKPIYLGDFITKKKENNYVIEHIYFNQELAEDFNMVHVRYRNNFRGLKIYTDSEEEGDEDDQRTELGKFDAITGELIGDFSEGCDKALIW